MSLGLVWLLELPPLNTGSGSFPRNVPSRFWILGLEAKALLPRPSIRLPTSPETAWRQPLGQDIAAAWALVAYHGSLLDHLVGRSQQCFRDGSRT
jgi:hypothetical protein